MIEIDLFVSNFNNLYEGKSEWAKCGRSLTIFLINLAIKNNKISVECH